MFDQSSTWQRSRWACVPESSLAAVRLLRRELGDEGSQLPKGVVDDVVIVVGELLLNAIEHGRPLDTGDVELGWRVTGDRVSVRVVDGGERAVLVPQVPVEDSLRGRGLFMVDAICSDWDVERADHTTVTAHIAR